jgi:hypothetical protein
VSTVPGEHWPHWPRWPQSDTTLYFIRIGVTIYPPDEPSGCYVRRIVEAEELQRSAERTKVAKCTAQFFKNEISRTAATIRKVTCGGAPQVGSLVGRGALALASVS